MAIVRRAKSYPAAGALLALGAPLGLLALRLAAARALPSTNAIAGELSRDPLTYAYVGFSTVAAFVLLGFLLGRKEDALDALAVTDALTGLANRRRFLERARDETARARRHRAPLSLLLVDVDRLKQINDAGGHDAGDVALKLVGDALRSTCRETDLAARIGGDEFALLLPSTAMEAARTVAARLRANLCALQVARGAPVTVSIGVAALPADGGVEVLVRIADRALYHAKEAGRNAAA